MYRSGSSRRGGGEELVVVEALVLEDQAPIGVKADVAGAVVVELDAVAVGVGQVAETVPPWSVASSIG